MRKLQLFIATHYLKVFWHDINLKLTLGYFLINEIDQWSYQLDRVTFSKNVFCAVSFALFFCQVCFVGKSNLWLFQMLTFLLKRCYYCKNFQKKSLEHIHDVNLSTALICKIPAVTMSRYLPIICIKSNRELRMRRYFLFGA